MRTIICIALLAAAPARELIEDKGGVQVWRRDTPGSDFRGIRGAGLVDAPVRQVALVLLDDAHAPEWVDSLAEARVVRLRGDAEYVEYNRVAMPLFVSDRDFVTTVSMARDPKARSVTILSEPAPDEEVPRPKGVVRGVLRASYLLESVDGGKRTRLTVEIFSDPRGSLPAWLVNFFQKDWARETIEGIRGQAKKKLQEPAGFEPFLSTIDY